MEKNLINFIDNSPSIFHVIENSKKLLKENGYKEIFENDKIKLNIGDKIYFTKADSFLLAMEIGNNILEDGMRFIGAHGDSPTFKIKPNPDIKENGYLKLNVEKYGGAILSTWFDRPLSLAGKVVLRSDDIKKPKEILLNIQTPILTIPNLAIHMNREVNKGYEINPQKDTLPIASLLDDSFLSYIGKEIKANVDDILDFELYLYPTEKGSILGFNNDFIQSSRLDDLWMVHAGLNSLFSTKSNNTKVFICFDNEEVGSNSSYGANTNLAINLLERIFIGLNFTREDFLVSCGNSYIISADLAHGIHPNYPEKHDPTNKPTLGKGPVIKYSSNQRYTTNSITASIFKEMCRINNIPFQTFVNPSNVVGGSTIGPTISSKLGIPALDIGPAILGMHSARETCALSDVEYMEKAFIGFYDL